MLRRRSEVASDYAAGMAAAKVEGRLEGHDLHFASINGSIERLSKGVGALGDQFRGWEVEQVKRDVAADTLAMVVRDSAQKQVTTRQAIIGLFVGFVSVFGSIMGVLAATGVLR